MQPNQERARCAIGGISGVVMLTAHFLIPGNAPPTAPAWRGSASRSLLDYGSLDSRIDEVANELAARPGIRIE